MTHSFLTPSPVECASFVSTKDRYYPPFKKRWRRIWLRFFRKVLFARDVLQILSQVTLSYFSPLDFLLLRPPASVACAFGRARAARAASATQTRNCTRIFRRKLGASVCIYQEPSSQPFFFVSCHFKEVNHRIGVIQFIKRRAVTKTRKFWDMSRKKRAERW